MAITVFKSQYSVEKPLYELTYVKFMLQNEGKLWKNVGVKQSFKVPHGGAAPQSRWKMKVPVYGLSGKLGKAVFQSTHGGAAPQSRWKMEVPVYGLSGKLRI
ncbi:hypothetical protein U1Q18_042323 [Sarracenia purpurea var. burkii]